MARKNPFANLVDNDRPRKHSPRSTYAMKGASRSILSSIDEMAARADKLIEGQTVVDLDTEFGRRFFRPRQAGCRRAGVHANSSKRSANAVRIRRFLCGPTRSKTGRYMVVFGHRRLQAAKLLGRKVRAVVKAMKDQEHVVAQGQENSARANLSFIEKALFAANIARLNYDAATTP